MSVEKLDQPKDMPYYRYSSRSNHKSVFLYIYSFTKSKLILHTRAHTCTHIQTRITHTHTQTHFFTHSNPHAHICAID